LPSEGWDELRESVPTTLAGAAAFAVHAFRHAERVATADDHAIAMEVAARNFVALIPSLSSLMPTDEERPSFGFLERA
jgi:hypothetical protein